MADADVVRQRIIQSIFSRRSASDDSYVAHIRIWEDTENGTEKSRYIILAQTSTGGGLMHKAKLNSNGTFSVGKTWNLAELRAVEAFSPQLFSVTLARTYRWQTDDPRSQVEFITSLVRLFRTVTSGAPLQIAGFRDPDAPSSSRQPALADQSHIAHVPTPDGASNALYGTPRHRGQPPVRDFDATSRSGSPLPRTQARAPRHAAATSRPVSPSSTLPPPAIPVVSERSRASSPSRGGRPPSPSSLSQTGTGTVPRPRRSRAPSHGTTETRISNSTTYSRAPSIAPTSPSPAPRPFAMTQGPSRQQSMESTQIPSSVSSWPSVDQMSTSATSIAPTVTSAELNVPTPMAKSRSHSNQSMNGQRPQANARVSFFDPANQVALDRLVSGDFADQEGAEGMDDYEGQGTLASVEEMLEGYELASDDILAKRSRGPADQIEARLLSELMALDKANIYSFLESDDRVGLVLQQLDTAIAELDSMDSMLSSYKIHLNAVNDDIAHIQSQNRGLQVQTQNQKALLNELEQLLQTVHVDRETLMTLAQESLEKPVSIQRLEEAAAELYKALQAGRDRDMAATMERLGEYQTHNIQFCKRLLDYLSIMFTAQGKMLLGDSEGLLKGNRRGYPSLKEHRDLETYLARYSGLILYLKEMDESTYGKLCGNYFSAASELHSTQIKALLSSFATMVKKAPDDDIDLNFANTTPTSASFKSASGIRRAGTIVRSGTVSRKDKDKQEKADREANMRVAEAFSYVLERIAPQVYREEEFISSFLQTNDSSLTFADHMGMENYYRRQAARSAGLSAATAKLARGGMDFVFGFLPAELKTWTDIALAKDSLQIVGVLAVLERFLVDADERGNAFLVGLLEKEHRRLKALFDRHINEQMKLVEQTKVTNKKRNGAAPFIKYFPTYIARVEAQLIGADALEIRANVDAAYERLVNKMFDSLRQMAKMDGEGEDKGQLNYHVILIENMHHFVAEMAQVELGSVVTFVRRAEAIYDENRTAYVKLVLRRPFAKLIDYFEGVDRLLSTTAPSEVASNSTYSKSSLKKVTKEYNGKDIRKHVDALFRRIEKHFTEASEKALSTDEKGGAIASGGVLVGVWRACEEELLRLTEMCAKHIAQCYGDTGVTLEYGPADIEAAFKRHSAGA